MKGIIRSMILLAMVGMVGISPALAQDMSKAEEYYRKGVEFMNNSRYLDAVEQFQLAIDEDPGYLDAHRRMAYVYTQMAKTETDYYMDALDKYEDILELLPEDDTGKVDVRKNIAFVQAAMGDLDDAIATYEEILEITPENCDVLMQIGDAHKLVADRMKANEEEDSPEYQERVDRAVSSYTQVMEICPDTLSAYEKVGEIKFFAGDQEGAAEVYEKMAEMDPDNIDILVRLAYLYKEAENWGKAAPVYTRILAIETENTGARLGYAKALQELGQFQNAAEQYAMLIEADPEKFGSLYCNLANLYALDAKDGDKTIEVCMNGIASNAPVQACLTYFWGKGLEVQGMDLYNEAEFDRAISKFKQAKIKFGEVQTDPNFGGHAKQQQGRLDQLIERTNQAKEKAKQGR